MHPRVLSLSLNIACLRNELDHSWANYLGRPERQLFPKLDGSFVLCIGRTDVRNFLNIVLFSFRGKFSYL